MTQLALDFRVSIRVPVYRMTWREGETVQIRYVEAHTVILK